MKDDALSYYQHTGEKTPAKGIQIKLFKTLRYPAEEALKWAMEKKECLTLDKKAFDKMMGVVRVLPEFVKITFEPKVQIATDEPKQEGGEA